MIRYTIYFANGSIYRGNPGWSIPRTRARAERLVDWPIVAIVGFRVR